MPTPLLAPIYSIDNIDCRDLPQPGGDLRNRRCQVTKKALRHFNADDREVVWDSGVVVEHWASTATEEEAQRIKGDLNAASFREHISGREFTRYLTRWYVSVEEAEAQRLAAIDHTPAEEIKITPWGENPLPQESGHPEHPLV